MTILYGNNNDMQNVYARKRIIQLVIGASINNNNFSSNSLKFVQMPYSGLQKSHN